VKFKTNLKSCIHQYTHKNWGDEKKNYNKYYASPCI